MLTRQKTQLINSQIKENSNPQPNMTFADQSCGPSNKYEGATFQEDSPG